MVKRILSVLLLTLAVALCFTACSFIGGIGHTHSFGEWETVKEAACTEAGEKVRYCECDDEEREAIAALGHNFVDGACTRCSLKESKGLEFTSNGDGTCYVSGIGTCTDSVIVISNKSPDGDKVTSIGYRAFYECSNITSVEIPNSVTSIGEWAFDGCTGLTSVLIPDSVMSIGEWAFDGCTGLTSVYITDIAAWCNISFSYSYSNPLYCAETLYLNGKLVTELVIPDRVTSIGDYAFLSCDSLASVVIGDSVTSIGDRAFSGCTGLTSVIIGDSVTSIGSSAFEACESLTSVVIGDSVTSIGGHAFYGCADLTSVVIPDSVTSIGDDAFSYCTGLTSVLIPDSVTSIGKRAFYGCTDLTIYCEAESKPDGWDSYWNYSNCPVVWGAETAQ